MKLSQPTAYIEILLKQIVNITENACRKMAIDDYRNVRPRSEIDDNFKEEMKRVEDLKNEILNVIDNSRKNPFE